MEGEDGGEDEEEEDDTAAATEGVGQRCPSDSGVKDGTAGGGTDDEGGETAILSPQPQPQHTLLRPAFRHPSEQVSFWQVF